MIIGVNVPERGNELVPVEQKLSFLIAIPIIVVRKIIVVVV
jgi:hypothetical protein